MEPFEVRFEGVIRGISLEHTAMDIQEQVVQEYNPTALQANRIGRSLGGHRVRRKESPKICQIRQSPYGVHII